MDKNFEMLFEEEKRTRIALELEFAEYRGKWRESCRISYQGYLLFYWLFAIFPESSSEIEDLLEKQISEMTQLVSNKDKEIKEIKEKAL